MCYCVNVPHVNKTVTDFGGIYTDIPPVATPLIASRGKNVVEQSVHEKLSLRVVAKWSRG